MNHAIEAPKEGTVLHFVAPLILAELLHLSLAGRVTFEESKVVSGGAYGDVSKGTCSIGGRGKVQVAIKRLRFYMKEDVKLLFEKEIYVWSKLRHKNILPLLGFALDDATGYPLLVSEWMGNGSAWKYVNSHHDCDLMRLITGIASGLIYLHGNGIVHSDIKSDNILVSDSGDAIICDFGCSRMITASRSMANISSGIKGSLRYIAHELLAIPGQTHEGSTRHTLKTDVWAFGMTELLTLQRPYTGLSDVQVISAIISRQIPSFPPLVFLDLHFQKINVLKGICLACWSHNPANRPDMAFFLSSLQSCQEKPDADRPPSLPVNMQFKPSNAPLILSPLGEKEKKKGYSSDKRSLKVGIMGDANVGKSTLILRFSKDNSIYQYDPTIEDEHCCNFTVDGEQIQFDVMDTSGLEEYSVLHEKQIQWATAFILVFSLSNKNSFSRVEELRQQIYQRKGPNFKVPIVIVGNMSDLTWQYELEQIRTTVEEWGLPFYKTSAMNNENIVDVFEGLARLDKTLHYGHATSEPTILTSSKRSPQCIIM